MSVSAALLSVQRLDLGEAFTQGWSSKKGNGTNREENRDECTFYAEEEKEQQGSFLI